MKDHFIVCGVGDVGHYVIEEMLATQRPFVAVDEDEELLKKLSEGSSFPYVVGDATAEEILAAAGIIAGGRRRVRVAARPGQSGPGHDLPDEQSENPHCGQMSRHQAVAANQNRRRRFRGFAAVYQRHAVGERNGPADRGEFSRPHAAGP
ncbi:MAG: hypothetical protein EXR96_02250 [Nitrospiraceae bacterium]|nr:hypothetical protein [Nitrospiraceae bacterium]